MGNPALIESVSQTAPHRLELQLLQVILVYAKALSSHLLLT